MKLNGKNATWSSVLVVLVVLVSVYMTTTQLIVNPISKLKVENIETIYFTPLGRLTPVGPQKSTKLPATEYRRIIETLHANRVDDTAPYKRQFIGRMDIESSNGNNTRLVFYETGVTNGFQMGKTSYCFKGDLAGLISTASENRVGSKKSDE